MASPANPSSSKGPRITEYQLLSKSGSIWATVQVPDHRQHVVIYILDPNGTTEVTLSSGTKITNPNLATITLHGAVAKPFLRKARAKRTRAAERVRPQAELTLAMRDQRTDKFLVPD